MIKYVRNSIAALLGFQQATHLRVVDPAGVTMRGGITVIDSGLSHPLVQHFEHSAVREHFSNVPTIDVGTFRTLKAIYRNPSNYKPDIGFLDDSQVALVEKVHGMSVDHAGETNASFEEDIKTAILTVKRTAIDLHDVHVGKEFMETLVSTLRTVELSVAEMAAKGRRLPILVMDILPDFENDEVHDLIKRINNHGCGVMLFRLVYVATPTTKIPSDLHVVERYPLRNKTPTTSSWENEAYLATGERVLVKTDRVIEQPSWRRRKSKTAIVPSLADYDAGIVEPFGKLQLARQ